MQNRNALLSVAIAPAAMLLAGTAAMAQAPPPLTTCRTAAEVTFTVSSGPTFVTCEAPGGVTQCTEIEYQASTSSLDVYALAGKGVVDVVPRGARTLIAEPCEGVDGFGQGACHQQAIRTLPGAGGIFKIIVAGERRAGPSSVAVAPQRLFLPCEILGIGLENTRNPDQLTQTTETVDFKGCAVEFTRDAATGEVLKAELTEDSPKDCTSPFREGRVLLPQPVATLEVKLKDTPSLGKGKFGDGYISTGNDSCTTRVIGGKVYTWGSPCPP